MKKGLLALLLAVALVAPAFAAKGDMSVNAKLGLGVGNTGKVFVETGMGMPTDDMYVGFKMDNPLSFGAEFFYGTSNSFSVGVGANYTFDSDTDFSMGGPKQNVKVGTTNIYFAIRPEFKLESKFISSVYLVGQIGLAIPRVDIDAPFDISVNNGLYLGAGFGTMIKDAFFVELILSSSNGSVKYPVSPSRTIDYDVQYTATTINVGYKFNI